MRRVLAFGSFDPLHEGHRAFFRQARAQGDHLTVIVARDAAIRARKNHEPFQSEKERVAQVARESVVDVAQLGEVEPDSYHLLETLDFEVVVLGYDQTPADEEVRRLLSERGKEQVDVVRLTAFKPERYKSSHFRSV